MRVQIHIRAEKLKNIARGQWRGKRSSPYCKVVSLSTTENTTNSNSNNNQTTFIGQTEVLHSNLNPQFATSFIVDHDETQGWTHLRISMYDCRQSIRNRGSNEQQSSSSLNLLRGTGLPPLHIQNHHRGGDDGGINNVNSYCSDTDPKMGEVDIEIGNILQQQSNNNGQETEIKLQQQGSGSIFIHVAKSIQGQTAGILDCQIRGLDIKNIESGLLGLGAVDPYYVISKKYNDVTSGSSRWYVVYRSEHIHNIINPYWKGFKLDLERFCNNDLNKEIKIAIYDQEDYGSDRWLGEVETTLAEMLESVAKRGNADRESALRAVAVEDDGKDDLRALLVILRADVIHA
jgi:hypothetical protein